MPKKSNPKAAAAAAKAATVARAVQASAKKQKKKSKSGFWNIVGGAAKMAAELAPVVAPLLLANHGPSARLAAANPSSAAAAVSAAPLATTSCATCTGMYGLRPKHGKDGRVTGVVVSGMDYLDDLAVDSEAAGTVLRTINLNPFSSDWDGTMLQRQASLFERYRPKRIVAMVEPTCAATTAGQLISYIDPDPTDELTTTGKAAIQEASAHEGADIAQVWQMAAASYAFDKDTQDFYADADGSDERLVSPGKWRILANSAMPADTAIGTLYVIWEYEFKIPQIDTQLINGAFARLTGQGAMTANVPLGPGTWDTIRTVASFEAQYDGDGTYGTFFDFPVGTYLVVARMTRATAQVTGTVDGEVFVDASTLTPTTTLETWANYISNAANDCMRAFVVRVTRRTPDQSVGFLRITCNGDPSASGVVFSQWPAYLFDSSLDKRRTLQDYERDVARMKAQMVELTSLVSRMAADHTPGGQPTLTPVPHPVRPALSTGEADAARAALAQVNAEHAAQRQAIIDATTQLRVDNEIFRLERELLECRNARLAAGGNGAPSAPLSTMLPALPGRVNPAAEH